jgi:hypothetical protein
LDEKAMSTFTILLIVPALAVVVSACDAPSAPGQGNPSSASATPADIGPRAPQPNAMDVVVGPSGLHAR